MKNPIFSIIVSSFLFLSITACQQEDLLPEMVADSVTTLKSPTGNDPTAPAAKRVSSIYSGMGVVDPFDIYVTYGMCLANDMWGRVYDPKEPGEPDKFASTSYSVTWYQDGAEIEKGNYLPCVCGSEVKVEVTYIPTGQQKIAFLYPPTCEGDGDLEEPQPGDQSRIQNPASDFPVAIRLTSCQSAPSARKGATRAEVYDPSDPGFPTFQAEIYVIEWFHNRRPVDGDVELRDCLCGGELTVKITHLGNGDIGTASISIPCTTPDHDSDK